MKLYELNLKNLKETIKGQIRGQNIKQRTHGVNKTAALAY